MTNRPPLRVPSENDSPRRLLRRRRWRGWFSGEKRGETTILSYPSCPPSFLLPFEQIPHSRWPLFLFFSLQLEYYVLLFKVFFRCPHKRLYTCQRARTNEMRQHERVSLRHRPRKKKTHPEKHPCTTRRRERDSITNALGSGKATGLLRLRLNSDADHPGRQKRKKRVNLHDTSAHVSTPYNIYIDIYMSFLFLFFGSTPCLSRHGFFFTFCFLKTLHFFYKKLSGRGTDRHIRAQCGPRKKMHMATLWHPFPQVSPCREKSATTGLGFFFFCFFFVFFLLNSSAGLRLPPPLPETVEGRKREGGASVPPNLTKKRSLHRYNTHAHDNTHTYT